MKITKMVAGAVAVLALMLGGCAVPEEGGGGSAPAETSKPKAKAERKETPAQKNARESAESYLDTLAFSREGLIRQLVRFEGFKRKDAVYGVDHAGANWKAEAAESAKSYLDTMPFSREGLIEQLVEFEGFTRKEAVYGVNQTGL